MKFDLLYVLFLPLIRRAFPAVPWVFLYQGTSAGTWHRILRQRGVQTVPGLLDARMFGVEPAASVTMPGPEYCARVLGTICQAAEREMSGTLVNYSQLPQALFDTILPHFGIPVRPDARRAMQDAARRSSKHPAIAFSAEADAAPIPAGGTAQVAVAAFLDGPYGALERRRSTTYG